MTDLNNTIKRLRGQVDWDFGRVMVNRRDLNAVLDELEKRREALGKAQRAWQVDNIVDLEKYLYSAGDFREATVGVKV